MSKKRKRSPKKEKPKTLKSLKDLDQMWVELVMRTSDPLKKFMIRDKTGNILFYGGEHYDTLGGKGLGRRFHLILFNERQKEILHVHRKEVVIWFGCFCGAMCREELRVTDPKNEKLFGQMDQVLKWSTAAHFEVTDDKRNKMMYLRGQPTRFKCCGVFPVQFEVLDVNGNIIGKIEQDVSTQLSHNFIISFPAAMDIKLKSVLLGACFMLVSKLVLRELISIK